ncbi:MAG: response regulator [Myxococcota bacterium]
MSTREVEGRIMVVDDEASVRKVTGMLLEEVGYEVATYADAESALAAFEAEPGAFTAVLTDLTLPRVDGIALARRLKAIRQTVPVLLTSGSIETSARDLAEVDEILLKPCGIEELRSGLERAIANAKSAAGP